MLNETKETNGRETTFIHIGKRLQSAREALSFTPKEVAAQLRLNEQIIYMLEKQEFPPSLPLTYICGYIRLYGKLLEIPDEEILNALSDFKSNSNHHVEMPKQPEPLAIGHYFVRFLTSFVIFTMIGLSGMWWYTHHQDNTELLVKNKPLPLTLINYADNNTIGIPLLPMDNKGAIATLTEKESPEASQKTSFTPIASHTQDEMTKQKEDQENEDANNTKANSEDTD